MNPRPVKDSHGRPGIQIVLHLTAQSSKAKAKLLGVEPGSTIHYANPYIIAPRTSRVLKTGDDSPNPLIRTTYLEVGWRNKIT